MLKRFLDDIFSIFLGTTKDLHKLLEEIKKIHKSIKFTMNHTTIEGEPIESRCSCQPLQEIPFLDTACSLKNGKIITKLYRKPSDRNQYLLTSSCHPASQVENIPFSLALRVRRICSLEEDMEEGMERLREMLLDRSYGPELVAAAISKARAIPREVVLQPRDQHQQKRPISSRSFSKSANGSI